MKKIKQSIASTLVVAMTAGLMACGSSGSVPESATVDVTKTQETSKESKSEDEVTLRFLTWQTQSKDLDQKVADAYMADHPNINIVYDYYGDMTAAEYHKKVDLMVLGGEEMDILMDGSFREQAQRAGSGTYLPVDEYFEEEGVKPEDIYQIVSRVDGKMYGIPGDLKSWFVMINKDYLDEAGLEVPPLDWTWDDYREYANKLTTGDGASKRYGSYFHTWGHFFNMGLWSTFDDNPMFNADMTATNFDDPVFHDFLQFRYDMEQTDKCQVPYSDVTSMNMNYRDKFFNGNVAMMPIGNYMIPELDDQDKYPHDFTTTFAPIPRWKDAEPGRTYTECLYYSIAKNSKHPKEAYDYIRFYTTEGMKIRSMSFSAEKGIDKMEFAKAQIEDPKYLDMDALEKVLTNPDWKDIVYNNVPAYGTEMEDIMRDEGGKYLLGAESLEEAISNMDKNGAALIAEKG